LRSRGYGGARRDGAPAGADPGRARRRTPYGGRQPCRRTGRAARRSAGAEWMLPFGRSDAGELRRALRLARPGRGAFRHGARWRAGLRSRWHDPGAGCRQLRSLGNARRGRCRRPCRRSAAAGPNRRPDRLRNGGRMIDHRDNALGIVAGLLEARTGQKLTADRLWRVGTALAGVLRQNQLDSLEALADRLSMPNQLPLAQQVVEALLNNETYFFRDRST